MSVAGLLLSAAAILCLPPWSAVGTRRLAGAWPLSTGAGTSGVGSAFRIRADVAAPPGSAAEPAADDRSEGSAWTVSAAALRRTVTAAGRRRCVLACMAAVGTAALGILPVAPAACAAVVGGLVVHLAWTGQERRAQVLAAEAGADCVRSLADELRAGRSPPRALALVAEHAPGILRSSLAAAARTSAMGGDTPSALREAALHLPPHGRGPSVGWPRSRDDPAVPTGVRSTPGRMLQRPAAAAPDTLARVAAGWELSQASGCSLASVLDAVDADLLARRQQRRVLAGLLSAPRATAGLLAVLPVLGLAMGSALGADPWDVLTRTATGQLALVAGVGLDVAGVLWTGRLVRGAGG